MTSEQKKRITELRSSGMGLADIGRTLGIPKETVKSYCRRNNISVCENPVPVSDDVCRHCGQPIIQAGGMKKRSFCSRDCCLAWWHSHPESLNKKALYTFTCAHCGREFTAYGNSKRKYCSHECYIADRFKGDSPDSGGNVCVSRQKGAASGEEGDGNE